ncbi:putative Uncharacterized transporter [Glarea lozoyensis 74030]|uniref:Putative Uncharacterized transporter n=1 Tax=Glarea lozoyensis (strain ATCC 74030 / MF5533) TaxID=1104152 RepID=H0EFI1_GLAL7|nr:putative Uncharacterized transporter [Glarea lozoyensis 74030]
MASDHREEAEKGDLRDNGTMRSESTIYASEAEKTERGGAVGEPDMDHEVVEEMDKGHMADLERGHTDPEMPLNFPEKKKWFILSLLASITFISPLASSMFAPGVSFMDTEFGNTSQILSALTTYGWQPELCGLAYIGLGIGFMAGLVVVGKISDPTVVRMTKANNGVFEPEMRLPACIFFACFVPVSFFWYGWAADKAVHWIVPIIGLIPFGFGMMGIFIPIQTYTIDSFPEYAASAVAALTVSRSLFGAFLPLAGPSMYEALGLGWGNSTLGFIGIALIPAPMFIYKYGGKIRKQHPVKL